MIVSLTAYRRPGYLRAVMGSLEEAIDAIYPEPVFVVARIEPSPVQNEMLDAIGGGRGVYVTVNDEQLHCRGNTLAVLDDAWTLAERFGEEYVVHCEEDFLLAPDCLAMHAYMRDRYRHDPDVLCTGSWTRTIFGPGAEHLLSRERNFSSQVWGTWKDRWPEIRADWRDRTPDGSKYLGWDVNFDTHIMRGRCQVRPILARCCHIGEEMGQHTTRSIFPKTLPVAFAGESGQPGVRDIEVEPGTWDEC